MADYKGTNYDKATSLTPATEDAIARGLWGGNIRVQVEKYTTTGNEAANDSIAGANGETIAVGRIPEGATLLDGYVTIEDLGIGGNNAELSMGWGDAANQLLSAEDPDSAIEKRIDTDKLPETVSSDTDILVKLGNATGTDTTDANKTIETVLFYSHE